MKKNKPKKIKRLLLKAIWFSIVAVFGIVVWFLLYAVSWEINQPSKSEFIPTLSATASLLILFVTTFVVLRKSSKTILRWTGKSFIILTPLMLLCSLAIVTTSLLSNQSSQLAQSPNQKVLAFNADNALNLINVERSYAGAVALSRDTALDQAATNLANDMVANNYRSFEGRDPWTFVNSTGYPYNYASFFFNDVNTNETDFVKSILSNQNLKSYVNGKQFLFAGIGTAQKDKGSPILAVVYFI